jgi:tRNA nucleotidyltransferase/poly(A) polymerase
MTGEDGKAYAGRWVARLRGRIIAQGGTPEQARRAAQSRFKETPEVLFMPTDFPFMFPPQLEAVRKVFPFVDGLNLYLVGGAVRDILLQRINKDLDFSLPREAIKTSRRIADALGAAFYPLDEERDTGRVILTDEDGKRMVMDFASFRGADLETDLRNRDFTLNAIAMDLRDDTLHDPLGGVMDLKEKRLRLCSATAMSDDPVRILRGIRLAANFDFSILPETRAAMKEAAGGLADISPERLRDELFHILAGQRQAACLRALDMLGALEPILPELAGMKGVEQCLPHVHDVWEHTLAVVKHLETILALLTGKHDPEKGADLLNGLLVMKLGRFREQLEETTSQPLTADRPVRGLIHLAALYHDVAKPACKQADENGQLRFWGHDVQGAGIALERARLLMLSNEESLRVETIVRNHMRVLFHVNRLMGEGKPPSRRAIYRFFRDSGPAGVDVCLLALADLRATQEQNLQQDTWNAALDVVRLFLENWFEKPAESIAPPALVDGNDLMRELKLQPGKQIGTLLEAVREAQAVGEVSTYQQAVEFARRRLTDEPNKRQS